MVQASWKALEAGDDYEGDDEQTFREEVYAEATKFMDRLQKNPDDTEACSQLTALNDRIKEQNRKDAAEEMDVDDKELNDGIIDYEFHIHHYKINQECLELLGKKPTNDADKKVQNQARETLPKIRPLISKFNDEKGYPKTWNLPQPVAKNTGLQGLLGLAGLGRAATVEDGAEGTPLNSELPGIKLENSDGSLGEIPKFDEPPKSEELDPEDLFVPQEIKRKPGQAAGVHEGWKASGASEEVIVKYGPLNSATYRLEKSGDLEQILDKTKTPEFTDHRLGDKKFGRRWLYTRRHFVSIQGVAFQDNGFDDPMEELKPKEEGEVRRYRPIQIKVKWRINDKYAKSWETRTTVQRLMGSKPAIGDKAIYIAVLHQEGRYKAFLGGDRKGADRSPSVSPELARMIANRSPTPEVDAEFQGGKFQDYLSWQEFQRNPKPSKQRPANPTLKSEFLSPKWSPAPAPAPGLREFSQMQAQLDGMTKMMEKLMSKIDGAESVYDSN